MAISRRKEITNFLVTQLSLIDGNSSTFDPSYIYKTNINGEVFRKTKFFEDVNNFPSIYIQAGEENRIYHSIDLVEADLSIVIRCYIYSESSASDLENLVQDIEHVLNNIPVLPERGILDITIDNIITDSGILDPYGIGEIFITIHYALKN